MCAQGGNVNIPGESYSCRLSKSGRTVQIMEENRFYMLSSRYLLECLGQKVVLKCHFLNALSMMNLLEGQCVTIATGATGHHIRTSGSQRLELNQQNASWRSHYHKGSILGLISSHLEAINDHKGTCINTKLLNNVKLGLIIPAVLINPLCPKQQCNLKKGGPPGLINRLAGT
jgi:hypothetical protein